MDNCRNIHNDPIIADSSRDDEIARILFIFFQNGGNLFVLTDVDESTTLKQPLLVEDPRRKAYASPGLVVFQLNHLPQTNSCTMLNGQFWKCVKIKCIAYK